VLTEQSDQNRQPEEHVDDDEERVELAFDPVLELGVGLELELGIVGDERLQRCLGILQRDALRPLDVAGGLAVGAIVGGVAIRVLAAQTGVIRQA